jgi:hypothetical protein
MSIIGAMVAAAGDQFMTEAYRATDHGRSWQRTFRSDAALNSADPACAFDSSGDVFFVTMGFPTDQEPRTRTQLFRSTDSGATWRMAADLPGSIDRPFVTAGHTRGAFGGSIYVHGKRDRRTLDLHTPSLQHLWIARSADGGRSYLQLDVPSLAPQIDIGRATITDDGTFVTVLGEIVALDDPSRNSIKAVRLIRGGTSILPAVRIADWGIPDSPNSTRVAAVAGHGHHVYAAWEDGRTAASRVMFSASANRGATWTEPRCVACPESTHGFGFNPALAVNRDGLVGLLWYDKRDHPGDLGWGVRFAISADQGKTFGSSVRVSERDVMPGPGLGEKGGRFSGNGGDTSGLVAEADGAFRAVWIDNRTGVPQVWTSRIHVARGQGAGRDDGG